MLVLGAPAATELSAASSASRAACHRQTLDAGRLHHLVAEADLAQPDEQRRLAARQASAPHAPAMGSPHLKVR
jgi:hypothetical protein